MTATPTWRCVTWNVDWRARNPQQTPRLDYLDSCRATVVALQEVPGPWARRVLEESRRPAVFSQQVYERATWRWMGCGLLFAEGTEILEQGVIGDLPKPQRGLWAKVRLPSGPTLTAVSWHAPNAAGDGAPVKMTAYRTMNGWLRGRGPVVLGADLNSWRDPVDLLPAERGDEFEAEHAFVGPQPEHGLRDCFRQVLEDRGELDRLRSVAPDGPLAVSYVLKRAGGQRMDRIFASPELKPLDAAYEPVEDATRAGSDHALHWVDFA